MHQFVNQRGLETFACLFHLFFFIGLETLGRRMVLGTHPSIIQAILKPAKRPSQCVLGLPLGLLPDTHA